MMKLEIFVVLILFISIEVMYEAKEINLYILPISNGLTLIMRLTIDLFENISLFIQFTALISASLIVVNCALLYITLPLLKELTEEN